MVSFIFGFRGGVWAGGLNGSESILNWLADFKVLLGRKLSTVRVVKPSSRLTRLWAKHGRRFCSVSFFFFCCPSWPSCPHCQSVARDSLFVERLERAAQLTFSQLENDSRTHTSHTHTYPPQSTAVCFQFCFLAMAISKDYLSRWGSKLPLFRLVAAASVCLTLCPFRTLKWQQHAPGSYPCPRFFPVHFFFLHFLCPIDGARWSSCTWFVVLSMHFSTFANCQRQKRQVATTFPHPLLSSACLPVFFLLLLLLYHSPASFSGFPASPNCTNTCSPVYIYYGMFVLHFSWCHCFSFSCCCSGGTHFCILTHTAANTHPHTHTHTQLTHISLNSWLTDATFLRLCMSLCLFFLLVFGFFFLAALAWPVCLLTYYDPWLFCADKYMLFLFPTKHTHSHTHRTHNTRTRFHRYDVHLDRLPTLILILIRVWFCCFSWLSWPWFFSQGAWLWLFLFLARPGTW